MKRPLEIVVLKHGHAYIGDYEVDGDILEFPSAREVRLRGDATYNDIAMKGPRNDEHMRCELSSSATVRVPIHNVAAYVIVRTDSIRWDRIFDFVKRAWRE